MKYANPVQENISMTMLTREITFPLHTVIKKMISVISSLCVKMCMNSGKNVCTRWNTLDYDNVDYQEFPNAKTIIFGSQFITEILAVLNFCIFHMKYYIYRQRLFQDNVFHLH